jgi:ABC-type transport system involved in multi-copper enzyme maturation permease subunit
MPALVIARLTLFEAVRRRLVLAVLLLTPLVVGVTAWGFSRLTDLRDNNGVPLAPAAVTLNEALFVVLIAFMFSVVLGVGAVFLAAPAIAADLESGLALAIFPRPIRRGSVVLGKWLGLSCLLALYTAVTAAAELVTIAAVTGYTPPHPAQAVGYIIGQSLILLTLALAGSTRLAPMTCGVIAVALYGMVWIVGLAEAIGATFHNQAMVTAGTIVRYVLPSDGLWQGAVYSLEPEALRAVGLQIDPLAVTTPPSSGYLVWTAVWLLAMLGFAVWSLNRRDL